MADIEIITSEFSQLQRALLNALYRLRACAVCGKKAWCKHREPLVDLAEVETPYGTRP